MKKFILHFAITIALLVGVVALLEPRLVAIGFYIVLEQAFGVKLF